MKENERKKTRRVILKEREKGKIMNDKRGRTRWEERKFRDERKKETNKEIKKETERKGERN